MKGFMSFFVHGFMDWCIEILPFLNHSRSNPGFLVCQRKITLGHGSTQNQKTIKMVFMDQSIPMKRNYFGRMR